MGNSGSSSVNGRRGSSSRPSHPPPVQTPQPEVTSNSYFFAAATPFTNAPGYYQYPGSYPLPPRPATPVPVPMAYFHLRGPAQANWFNGRYPCGHVMQPSAPYVEHQKAVTIRNDVNLKKKTLRVEPDEANPGKYLVAFTFDATMAGRQWAGYGNELQVFI